MDLSLTEAQRMLKASAREFLSAEYPLLAVRRIDDSEHGFSPELWRKMAELGWTAMALPAEYGGVGSNLTDLGVLYEELGYACIPSPHHSSAVLGGLTILEAGSTEQKESLLPSVASGERILAFAFTEPDYGWGPEFVQLKATRGDGGFLLNGTKLFVPDASVADQLVAVARTSKGAAPEDGITTFIVDATAPGVSIRQVAGWTGDRMNEITFNNVAVPASDVVGEVDGGWAPLDKVLDRATILICAYMVGGMQRAYEMAREYSTTRIAFGAPIGTFQRVQDDIIDCLNALDSARWTTYEALWKMDEGLPDASEAVSMAKAVASQSYPVCTHKAHVVFAGIGTDKELGLYLYTKKSFALQSYLGNPTYHKERMARLLKV